jgi:methionyl-tRNA formyltransferase
MKPRALFFGTPEFAVASLDALTEVAEVVACVCQPDRPQGRGMVLAPPPVKLRATELGIAVVQPTKLRTGEFGSWVRECRVDVALVVAYGRILPRDVLDGPRLGCVNVHASLLPKYRGAAPITWAVVNGETETGITLMLLDEGMDTGKMLAKFVTKIDDHETAGALSARLARLGADAVRGGVPRYVSGGYAPEAQDDAQATLAPMLTKDDGVIDWSRSAKAVHDHVRGMSPWPGAFTSLAGKAVKIHQTAVVRGLASQPRSGEVLFADKSRLVVATGDGAVDVLAIQLEGKKPVRGVDWVIGRGIAIGDILGA